MTTLVKRNKSLFPARVSDWLNRDIFDVDGTLFNNLTPALVPSVNVIENEKDFRVELAAPGLEKKDFKIEVENGVLTISAEKQEETKEEKKNYSRQEFSYNQFSRSFQLPENCLADKIDAKYENGVLKLVLPKKEVTVAKAKKEIKVS